MAEVGIYDLVADKLNKRRNAVQSVLRKRFKKTKPFRTEEVSNDEMLVYYNQMTGDVNSELYLKTLIERHGETKVNDWIADMEQAKRRRGL